MKTSAWRFVSMLSRRMDTYNGDLRKLNLGCGFDKRDGWLNVDNFDACAPDVRQDIESFPWCLPTGSFDHILMKHVLEHVGQDFQTFKRVMQELYRIAAPGGRIEIHVPHVRHDTFWSDPTHVRSFTPLTFQMMSKKKNLDWVARRANYTMLALLMEVDFEVEETVQVYAPEWQAKVTSGELTREELRDVAAHSWNVAKELKVIIRAIK
jgi:SAM-dependent methyltransferase